MHLKAVMSYEMWATTVPAEITGDFLWKMEAYACLLLAMVPDQRTYGSFLKDDSPEYETPQNEITRISPLEPGPDPKAPSRSLHDISMP
jgi:hypothetical protein